MDTEEMKEVEDTTITLNHKQASATRSRRWSSLFIHNNSDDDLSAAKPLDAGFDAVYDQQLTNALLRNCSLVH
jgi:hypothetical protein